MSTSISSLLCGYFNLFPPSRHQQLHITLIEGADSELNCVFSTQLILKHTMTFYIYEEYMKAAVAQPDPSLKPRAAHTHSESSARGGITREGQPRHKSPDSHRDCPRSTALYGPEGFWVFFFLHPPLVQRITQFATKPAVRECNAALDGTGLLQTSN